MLFFYESHNNETQDFTGFNFLYLALPNYSTGGCGEGGYCISYSKRGNLSLSQKPIIIDPVASALNSQASALLAFWFIC